MTMTLADAATLQLPTAQRVAVDRTKSALGDTKPWARRVSAELESLCRLAQLQPNRLAVLPWLLTGQTLRVAIRLRVKTPCRPDAGGALRYADEVAIGLTFPPELLSTALPGTTFAEILNPGDVFLPNVLNEPAKPQVVCLGVSFPRGMVTLQDLALRLYDTLRGKTASFIGDSAGVLNPAASRYFEARPDLLPTTPSPFIAAPEASHA